MPLSDIGWVDGITASCVLIISCIFGIYCLYRSRKTKANLVLCLGFTIIFAGLVFLGVVLDFWNVFFTGKNINNPNGFVGLISVIWFAPLIFLAIYIGAELMMPNKKWYIVTIYLILVILFEVLLFSDPLGSFLFIYPSKSGDELIDYNLRLTSPAGILWTVFIISMIVYLGFGFLYKAIKTTGNLRKRFLFLWIGIVFYGFFGFIESSFILGYLIIPVRIGIISGPLIMYFGLKE